MDTNPARAATQNRVHAAALFVLDSFRPKDAGDSIFAASLHEVAADDELRARFEDTQRFDALITARFHEAPVPDELRSRILARTDSGADAETQPASPPP